MKKINLLVLGLLPFTALSHASTITLESSVEKVLESNPIMLENLSSYKAAVEDLNIAESGYYPQLDLVSSIGEERLDNINGKVPDRTVLKYYKNSLVLKQNIFNGFGTQSSVDYQKSRGIASAYNFVETADDVAYEMANVYLELLKQKDLLVTAKEDVAINEEIFDKVKALENSGLTTRSEMKKIESSLSLARSNLIVQMNNLEDASYNFQRVYGEPVDYNNLVEPTFKPVLPKTLEEATAYAVNHNPSIKVSTFNIKASKAFSKQSDKNFYPKLDLVVSQDLHNNINGNEEDYNRFNAGIVLSYNLYKGGADKAQSEKAKSLVNQEIQTKHDIERQVRQGMELSWTAYQMIERQKDELSKYRDFSEETLALYREEYDLGRRTLLDLLSTQNDIQSAKVQMVTAKYDHMFAKYRILDSMGLLINGILLDNYEYMHKVGLGHPKEAVTQEVSKK